jgi:DNA topoisomerase-6 subunit B
MAPPTNCLSPIGVKQILAGLLKGVKAEFYTATTREPSVYRGNPFQIEVGLAYGGQLEGESLGRVIRFANRVPLLYQQSACCAFKAVLETSWKNYGLSQSRGALPQGPLVIMIHMASVWVPFTSESKEAIADYDEIRKEIKLAVAECGRKLNTFVRRRARIKREGQRRGIFERYIGEVVDAMHTIDRSLKKTELREQFEAVARQITLEADTQFDEDGNPITPAKKANGGSGGGNGSLDRDEATVIIGQGQDQPSLDASPTRGRKNKTTSRTPRKAKANDDSQYELYD